MADEKKPTVSGHNAEAHKNTPEIDRVTFTMPLDAPKAEAVKRCIANGELKVTLTKVNLGAGRLGEAWEYD